MGQPSTPVTYGIPFASADARYYSRYPQGDAPVGGGEDPFGPLDPGFLPLVPGGGGWAMDWGAAFRNGSSTHSNLPKIYLCNLDPNQGVSLVPGKTRTYYAGLAAACEHQISGAYPDNKLIYVLKGGKIDAGLWDTYYHTFAPRGRNATLIGYACPGDHYLVGYGLSFYGCADGAACLGIRFSTDVGEPTKPGAGGALRAGISVSAGGVTGGIRRFLLAHCENIGMVDQGPSFLSDNFFSPPNFTENNPALEVGVWECIMGPSYSNSIHEWSDQDATLCNQLYGGVNYCGLFPNGYFSAHPFGPMTYHDVEKTSFIRCIIWGHGARNPAMYCRVGAVVNCALINHGSNGWDVCQNGTNAAGPSNGPGGTPTQFFMSEGIQIGWHTSDEDPKPFKYLIGQNVLYKGNNGFSRLITSQSWDGDATNPDLNGTQIRILTNHQPGYSSPYGDRRDYLISVPSAGGVAWLANSRVIEAEAPGLGADAVNAFQVTATTAGYKDFLDRLYAVCGPAPKDRGASVDLAAQYAIPWGKNSLDNVNPKGEVFNKPSDAGLHPNPTALAIDPFSSSDAALYWEGDMMPLDEATNCVVNAGTGRTPIEEWTFRRCFQRRGFRP